jgi:acetylglutamate kinase
MKRPRVASGVGRKKTRIVLKLGGELLELPEDLKRVAKGIAALSEQAALVVVHGGGREIDAALATAGIPKQQVDGLRVTDEKTLDVVVAVLAGAINTRLVAAVRGAGGKPVGVACIGSTRDGQLLNVNADTLASHIAAAVGARRLVIAGGTPGVLDEQGRTIERLTARGAAALIRVGTANKGMVAKLEACRNALRKGVGDVLIANGRQVPFGTLAAAKAPLPGCTQVVR